MFTGIITDIGKIESILPINGDIKVTIKTSYDISSIDIGASIACSGVCLTVVEKKQNLLSFDISKETLSCSNLSLWKKGQGVNLERSLKLGDELGGHMVLGHVDSVAEIINIEEVDASKKITFRCGNDLKKFIAFKGSVTLNGVSLTVNEVNDTDFSVNIIPHTMEKTTFKDCYVGEKINLEVDLMARYVSRLNEG